MKVAFFVGSLNRGGTEMLILDVFKKKASTPFNMILLYRNEGNLSNDYKMTGVPMFRVKPQESKLAYFRELRNLLKRERVDVLHAQTLTNAQIGIMCTAFSKVKLVFTFHGLFSSLKLCGIRHLVIWKSDATVFVSNYIRDWYYQHTVLCPKHRCHMVYNGIDFNKLEVQYPEPDFFREYERERTVRLAMVGSFMSGRSHMVVCKGLYLLKDQGVDFHFYFVGGQNRQEPWVFDQCVSYCRENGLLDRVHFLGGRGDVPAILQHIDGFVYSTVRDTFGISVIEAVSAGVPTLTNDWAVMKEISCDETFFSFFESGNEIDCCEKMHEMIKELKKRKEEAKQISMRVKDLYSIENHIFSLSKVYSEVCN